MPRRAGVSAACAQDPRGVDAGAQLSKGASLIVVTCQGGGRGIQTIYRLPPNLGRQVGDQPAHSVPVGFEPPARPDAAPTRSAGRVCFRTRRARSSRNLGDERSYAAANSASSNATHTAPTGNVAASSAVALPTDTSPSRNATQIHGVRRRKTLARSPRTQTVFSDSRNRIARSATADRSANSARSVATRCTTSRNTAPDTRGLPAGSPRSPPTGPPSTGSPTAGPPPHARSRTPTAPRHAPHSGR